MANIIVALILFYIATNIFGFFIEKIRIPKIYAALFLGLLLSTNTQIEAITKEPSIYFLTQVGMFSLLFLLGFNLNLTQLKKQSRLIVKVTFWMISCEVVVGTLLLHFIFAIDWFLAGFIALSFATVGEEALLPILEEFKLTTTRLGQTILGVSIMDDVVEIASFVILVLYISGTKGLGGSQIFDEVVPFVAIISGVLLNHLRPKKWRLEKPIKILAFVIFGPIFFFYAGVEADLGVFLNKIGIIVLITLAIKATKLCSVYFSSHREMGFKKSIVMAVSLSIKFSTSIIILLILLQKNLISEELFSVLIGVKVMFKFIVPILLAFLLKKWHMELKNA